MRMKSTVMAFSSALLLGALTTSVVMAPAAATAQAKYSSITADQLAQTISTVGKDATVEAEARAKARGLTAAQTKAFVQRFVADSIKRAIIAANPSPQVAQAALALVESDPTLNAGLSVDALAALAVVETAVNAVVAGGGVLNAMQPAAGEQRNPDAPATVDWSGTFQIIPDTTAGTVGNGDSSDYYGPEYQG